MMRPSIRLRSAAALSLIVTVIWLGTAVVTARRLTSEMAEVFDSALQETGQRILQLAVVDVLNRDEEGVSQRVMPLDDHEEYFTYVVRDDLGRVLLTSHRADPAHFPSLRTTGFHETSDMRLYHESAVRGTVSLTIAEPLSHRRAVAREVALGLALPLVVMIPLSIAGIFYGLGYGLRPLGQLRLQLARRGANDLTPLPTAGMAVELQPIAGTLNQLLARLDRAFTAERSFAANAAHELRTPLAGALAQVQRLRQALPDPESAGRAAEIEATLKRLTRLSERLMQLARAEGARLLAEVPQDIRPVLQIVAGDFARGADAGRVMLSLPDTAVPSDIDPDAVAIISRNLIENALRHGDAGPVGVTLDLDGTLCVVNGGPPVAPADLAALRGRFVRGRDAGAGSGLGLAIVQTMAERLGTALRLTSPLPGKDTGFSACICLHGAIPHGQEQTR
jgi:two-component system OmpR family sensor kinase